MLDLVPIGSKRVRLRAVKQSDYGLLYSVSTDPALGYLWRYRGRTPSPEQFASDLWSGVLAQFIVERPSGEFIALVAAYQADQSNGTCYVAVLSSPAVMGSGLALEGCSIFIDYLFRGFALRRVFAEVPHYSFVQMSSLTRFFVEEGLLRKHSFYAGQYWDLHILALDRERWEGEFAGRVRGLLNR